MINQINFTGSNEMWHGSLARRINYKEIIVKQLNDLTNKNVQVYLMHGNILLKRDLNEQVLSSNTLNIVFWSTILEKLDDLKYDEDIKETMWGYQNFYKDLLYLPNGEGQMIITPEGKIVAEYFKEYNMLCILYDNLHCPSPDEEKIFEKIMEEFQIILIKEKGMSVDEFLKQKAERERIEKEKRLIAFFIRNEEEILNNYKANYDNAKRYTSEFKTKVTRYAGEMKKFDQLIRNFTFNKEEGIIKVKKIIDEIASLDKIKSVDVESDKLIVITNTLYAETKRNKRYLMGCYDIKINLNNANVTFFNTSEQFCRKSYWTDHDPHPHVDGNSGEACLGNISATIADLIGQKEFFALITILINFLEQANIDDSAGRHIINWDEVDENNNIIIQGQVDATPGIVTCNYCENNVPEQDIRECDNCGTEICTQCYYINTNNGERLCENCYNNEEDCYNNEEAGEDE